MYRIQQLYKKLYLLGLISILVSHSTAVMAQRTNNDVLDFGNTSSEEKHSLKANESEIIEGGLNEPARILLPRKTVAFDGGTMAFKMSIDPNAQNYFSVKLWGSDKDRSMIMLFAEGKQIGYRHLGDIDFLYLGNGQAPLQGRFFYVTLPLPLKMTKGKSEINLEIRSYGEIWAYGTNFAQYQKNMTASSLGFYKAYTHTTTKIQPEKKEKQGRAILNLPLRNEPGEEVIDELKQRVNNEIATTLKRDKPLNQHEIMFLSAASKIKWTTAYQNSQVIDRIILGIDDHYRKYVKDPGIIYSDPNIYNYEWLVTGPIGRAIRQLWTEISPALDKEFDDGSGRQVSRRKAWSTLMEEAIKYSTTHRRQYTNQSMIIDLFLYDCNEALRLLDRDKALPKKQTLDYLYQSVGLRPWLGKETPNGPERNLGDNYWQLTSKGLTKELGFVGYYGEVLDWVVDIFNATGKEGVANSGDPEIRKQLLKMMAARGYFRYPAADEDGKRAMRIEAVIGWRDNSHYPGDVIYGDRAIAWDASPLMTAASTHDTHAIGIAQQMIGDNQFFKVVSDKMKLKGLRVTKSLLTIPDDYEWIKTKKAENFRLPMSAGMPDFIFSDEEDGVVAIKNGNERLYASLYWRARNAINNLAKVHYMTPENDFISNIYIHSEYQASGMVYKRPDWVNMGFANKEWYPSIKSAHTGEELPIAKIPAGVKFKPGDENVYAGKADFYCMVYGKYLIAMNTRKNKNYEFTIPKEFQNSKELVSKKDVGTKYKIIIEPESTIVLYKK
ncbi:hypothetical protein O0931_09165 [Pedobacter sp. SJ11]|uniref:Uncharacterized protein n=1 Tax=Pedobacter rhodius TaxID=3004098 RepID=A0ABT4KXG7_9SPHI|nr:hypothetical protein [Pedobacter sp. SJ11]